MENFAGCSGYFNKLFRLYQSFPNVGISFKRSGLSLLFYLLMRLVVLLE